MDLFPSNRPCAALILMLSFFFGACSVKEDRTECPNWLLFILENTQYGNGRKVSDLTCVLSGEGNWSDIRYLRSVSEGTRYGVEVPKGTLNCLVCAGKPEGLEAGKGLEIPYGLECPELYAYSSCLEVQSEWETDTVRLHKNYCSVSFHLESLYASSAGREILFRVTGDVCGCDMSAHPLPGAYMCEVAPDSGMRGTIRVPRQMDSSLKLSIVIAGQIARTFPLGRYIESSGYDWTAENLTDVDVEIVFEMTETVININMFEKDVELEICV